MRISMISASVMALSTILGILLRESMDPVILAMLLSYVIRLAEFVMFLMYLIGQTEKKFVSF